MELVNALSAATPCPVRCFIGGRITRLKIFLTRVSARGVKERLDLRFCVNGEEELTIDELRQTSRILRDDAKHTTLMYLSTGIELDRMSKRVNPQWVDLRGLLALTPNSLLRGTCTVYALATEPMPPSLAPRASDASRTPRLSGASRTEDASDTDCLGVAIEFGARLLASVQYCPGGEQRLLFPTPKSSDFCTKTHRGRHSSSAIVRAWCRPTTNAHARGARRTSARRPGTGMR